MGVIYGPAVPAGIKPTPASFLGPASVPGNWWQDLAVFQWLPEQVGVPRSPLGSLDHLIIPALEGTPTWQMGADGPELSFSGAVDNLDIKGGEIDYTKNPFTFLLRFSTTDSDDGVVFFGLGNTSDNDPLAICQNNSPITGSGLKFLLRDRENGIFSVGNSSTAHRDGLKHTAIVTYDGSSALRMWLDGVEQTETGGSGPGLVTTFDTRMIAALERVTTALHSDMQCSVFGEWHRQMPEGEVLELNRDPFAPARSYVPVGVIAAPVGGLSIPIAMHHYLQQRAAS